MEIAKLLREKGFNYNKQFGQNFITDTNLLQAIVNDSGVQENDTVVEIGAGAGTLTRELAKKTKKVIAFEIDNNLKPIHEETLKQLENVEIIYGDFLKYDISQLTILAGGNYRVVANLPYYITTPIIMNILENDIEHCDSLTVMVQKEVGERLVAQPNTENYGAITCSVGIRADVSIKRIVNRKMFFPVPTVDSCITHIEVNRDKYKCDTKAVVAFMRNSFAMRRKTLANNILNVYKDISREKVEKALIKCNLLLSVRGESLSIDQFINLYEEIFNEKSI